ncbi:MAG: 23S rRNA (pseudouridine(1915)-N(3))-methyltransferase RlmH [Pseudomonadota bacterium]
MRVHICAVGRLRAGPELALIEDYLSRFDRSGRNLGLGPSRVIEVEDKKGVGRVAEENLLLGSIPKGAKTCLLDERGKTLTSPNFADELGRWRDTGCQDLALLIGGADGFSLEFRENADLLLSFGAMVWPHMLARVMLSEQLYRASTILAGTPYHRV